MISLGILDKLKNQSPLMTTHSLALTPELLLRQSIVNDLEDLLNTRQSCLALAADLPALQMSLLKYGLPDMRDVETDTESVQHYFCQLLVQVISQYEPRLQKVTARFLPHDHQPVLKIQIDAMLLFDASEKPIIFITDIVPANGKMILHIN